MLLGLDKFLGTSGVWFHLWFGLKRAGNWNMNFALFFEFCEFLEVCLKQHLCVLSIYYAYAYIKHGIRVTNIAWNLMELSAWFVSKIHSKHSKGEYFLPYVFDTVFSAWICDLGPPTQLEQKPMRLRWFNWHFIWFILILIE